MLGDTQGNLRQMNSSGGMTLKFSKDLVIENQKSNNAEDCWNHSFNNEDQIPEHQLEQVVASRESKTQSATNGENKDKKMPNYDE